VALQPSAVARWQRAVGPGDYRHQIGNEYLPHRRVSGVRSRRNAARRSPEMRPAFLDRRRAQRRTVSLAVEEPGASSWCESSAAQTAIRPRIGAVSALRSGAG